MSRPDPLIISRALSLLAIALWLASLTQPALILSQSGANPDFVSGAEVLGTGWLGLGVFTAGWFANLPFLFAAPMVLFGASRPWKIAIFGLLLALDTFRLQSLPGGGGGSVYGYGLGAALWFAAFGVLLLAVVWRSLEVKGRASFSAATRAPAVLATVALLAIGTGIYGIHAYRAIDRASARESRFLPSGSVKVGKVCTDAIAAPTTRLRLDGPLEVIGSSYPLGSPQRLLAWGIPVVRKQGFDFALSDAADINSIYWKPADGPAVATLALSGKNHDTIEAALASADGLTTAFRQSWTRDIRKSGHYCPDYVVEESNASSPPRSLLVAALDVPGGLKPASIARMQNALMVAPFTRESLANAKIHGVRTDPAAVGTSPPDAGCAPRTGFVAKDPGALTLGYGGQTFGIDERRYYLMNNQPLSAVCDGGDSVYLYYFWLNSDRKSFLLYIQRRHLADFRKVWTMVTGLDYQRAEPFKGKADVRIRSLSEKDGQVAAELIDIEQSLAVSVSFGVPGR